MNSCGYAGEDHNFVASGMITIVEKYYIEV